MTTLFKVWARGDSFEFASRDQVEQFIAQLEREAKAQGVFCSVQVSVSDSTGMLITVGGSESYTLFHTAGERPPAVAALGSSDDDTLIEFDFMGELSQIERRYWIPTEEAFEALRHYLHTGTRSNKLNWV